jgi:hypothetical protein
MDNSAAMKAILHNERYTFLVQLTCSFPRNERHTWSDEKIWTLVGQDLSPKIEGAHHMIEQVLCKLAINIGHRNLNMYIISGDLHLLTKYSSPEPFSTVKCLLWFPSLSIGLSSPLLLVR